MDHEIYRITLTDKMENKYFSDFAKLVYKKTKCIVFAIELIINGRTIIRMNPSDYLISNIEKNKICVYSICPDPRTAEAIETIDMNKEEKKKYFIQKIL